MLQNLQPWLVVPVEQLVCGRLVRTQAVAMSPRADHTLRYLRTTYLRVVASPAGLPSTLPPDVAGQQGISYCARSAGNCA